MNCCGAEFSASVELIVQSSVECSKSPGEPSSCAAIASYRLQPILYRDLRPSVQQQFHPADIKHCLRRPFTCISMQVGWLDLRLFVAEPVLRYNNKTYWNATHHQPSTAEVIVHLYSVTRAATRSRRTRKCAFNFYSPGVVRRSHAAGATVYRQFDGYKVIVLNY